DYYCQSADSSDWAF
nr:immunoglobulin light chain junction region [Macaca mulatta]